MRYRLRTKKSFFGRESIVLQVKVRVWDDPTYGNGGGMYVDRWKDAEFTDLTPELLTAISKAE